MKRKSVSILNNVVDKLDATQNIDKTDTLIGKHLVIDAKDLSQSIDDIKAVITTLKQEIEFDDALKYVGAVPVITGDKDTDALLEDERLNQEKLNIGNICHIHSWERLQFDKDCPLCLCNKIEIPSYFNLILKEIIEQLFNSIQCDGDRCSCQISDEYYHLNEVSNIINRIRHYTGE